MADTKGSTTSTRGIRVVERAQPMATLKNRLFEAASVSEMLRKAEEGGEIENVAAVLSRLISEALDVVETMEATHHG